MTGQLLVDSYGKIFNQTFMVGDRLGASGTLSLSDVARSKPDSYISFFVVNGIVTNLKAPSNIRYNVLRDFKPINISTTLPEVMVILGTDQVIAHSLTEETAYRQSDHYRK